MPTVRSVALQGEPLKLKIIALDKQPVESVVVHVRPLGKGSWRTIAAKHLARGVYEAKLRPARNDFEYYVTATRADGAELIWPAAAPTINQTVVVAAL